jgi:hypothetical protein
MTRSDLIDLAVREAMGRAWARIVYGRWIQDTFLGWDAKLIRKYVCAQWPRLLSSHPITEGAHD